MDNVYENINDYNPIRKRKKLTVLHDIIADIMTNKKLQAIIKELFIRCRKLNISLVLIKYNYFIMKINNSIELKNIATDHSADIDYQDFKKIF